MHLPFSPAQNRSDCTGYCTGTGAGKFYAIPWQGIFCTEGGAGSIPPSFFGLAKERARYTVEKENALCRKFGIRGMPLCLVTGVVG